VNQVFKTVCLRVPASSSVQNPTNGDAAQIQSMITSFQNGYSLRQAFAEAAAYCMGN
jgi:hypothetical protein